jgi:AcrR family transcriptional regulator
MNMGRPRAFDADKALDKALKVFLAKGYEGASLGDLTKAMGINPPSLYAAFGNKQTLFLKAVDRYVEEPAQARRDALAAPTAREAVERLLRLSADLPTRTRNAPGCLLVHGALACGEGAEPVRRELALRRAAGEAELRERLEIAKADGDLPADAEPAALARYLSTLIQGMAVQAQGGATRKELLEVVDMALKSWPGATRARLAQPR